MAGREASLSHEQPRFVWADAWLLTSILLGRDGPVSVSEILVCADYVNHAIMTPGELDEGLARLIGAGYVRQGDGTFQVTEPVLTYLDGMPADKKRSVLDITDSLREFLGAEPWSSSYKPPMKATGLYVTNSECRRALREYRKQAWAEIRHITKRRP